MTPPIEVLICVSAAEADGALCKQLHRHLAQLREEKLIRAWDRSRIVAGEDSRVAIERQLEAARLVLVLVSSHFLASASCRDHMMRALDRHRAGEALVIPVILAPCDWSHPPLSALKALPTGGQPISAWSNIDEAWTDVVLGVRASIVGLAPSASSLVAQDLGPATSGAGPLGLRMPEVRVLLDRFQQWSDVVSRSRRDGHQLFLLHGTEEQALQDFTQRVRDYLEDHDVHVVSTDSGNLGLPTTPEMWEERLVAALSPKRRGVASTVLHDAAEEQPLFLVFGKEPINPRLTPPEQFDALERFLRGRFGEILSEAAPQNPLRLYVAIEEPESGFLHARFDAALEDLRRRTGATYWGKHAVTFPDWIDVRRFIDEQIGERLGLPISEEWMTRLRVTYDHHGRGARRFRDLCADIDRLLRQLPGGAS